jgi:hypothetical protein
MSKRRKRNNKTEKNTTALTYADALEAAGRARIDLFAVVDQLQLNLKIGSHTQAKLQAVVAIMDGIGKLPGDFPKEKFDQPITYHKLQPEAVDWLEKNGIPARRIAPFATYTYRDWFARKNAFLVPDQIIEKFFSHFIHCLLVETQIIIAKQYYQGLGLNRPRKQSVLEAFPNLPPEYKAEIQDAFDVGTYLGTIEVDQLHGRIFLEYCVMMIRAQWDKLVSLACIVFDQSQSWDSISDALKALDRHISSAADLNSGCKAYSKIFLEITNEKLAQGAWLKSFRDHLVHSVGQHSLGVAPQRTSSLTTSELWDKMCEEHNWLREAMMTLLIVFAYKYS